MSSSAAACAIEYSFCFASPRAHKNLMEKLMFTTAGPPCTRSSVRITDNSCFIFACVVTIANAAPFANPADSPQQMLATDEP
jgi:hypothetical protein